MSNFKDGKFSKFIAGKGFYAVLALCLVGAGTAAWMAVDRTIDSIDQNNKNIINNQSSQSNAQWDFPPAEETKKPQSNVEVSSKPSSSASNSSSSSKAYTPPKKQSESPQNSNTSAKVSYVLPIEGEIFNPYSGEKLVKDVTLNEWRTHNGIDIKAPQGTDVVSVADGTITNVYTDKLWGAVIEITHRDGNISVYAGVVPETKLTKGTEIKVKQKIGVTDKVPCEIALDPHLHFTMKNEGNIINPLEAMGKLK